VQENANLRNQLAQNFVPFDTSRKAGTLILRKDSLEKIRKFYYYPAKVVGNTFTLQKNYITIERGALQGIKKIWQPLARWNYCGCGGRSE